MKQNPYLSMYLSWANAIAARQRAAPDREMGRQQAEFTRQATRMWTDAWLAWLPRNR